MFIGANIQSIRFKVGNILVTGIHIHYIFILCVCTHPVKPDRAENVPQPSSHCHQRLGSCSGAAVSPRPNPQGPQLEGFQDGHEQGNISLQRNSLNFLD